MRYMPLAGRRELPAPLVTAMRAAAGLGRFERGDVFARVGGVVPPRHAAATPGWPSSPARNAH
jgi:hypothetical protein